MDIKEPMYDVVIVGAGISGISAAYYMKKLCPRLKFLVLERRENIGGTWDLFKYPGIRSKSQMPTYQHVWDHFDEDFIVVR